VRKISRERLLARINIAHKRKLSCYIGKKQHFLYFSRKLNPSSKLYDAEVRENIIHGVLIDTFSDESIFTMKKDEHTDIERYSLTSRRLMSNSSERIRYSCRALYICAGRLWQAYSFCLFCIKSRLSRLLFIFLL